MRVDQSETQLVLATHDGRCRWTFALDEGVILGLQSVRVEGVELTSPETALFPLLAEEFAPERRIWPFSQLERIEHRPDGGVWIHARLLGSTAHADYRRAFVLTGDTQAALAAGLPEDLQALRTDADAARRRIFELLASKEKHLPQWSADLADTRAALKDADEAVVGQLKTKLLKLENRRRKTWAKHLPTLRRESAEADTLARRIDTYERALRDHALAKHPSILRDHYAFAHLRRPQEICALSYRRAWLAEARADVETRLRPEGALIWAITPTARNIAGWPWRGWAMRYRFHLPAGHRVNVLRQLSTWEIGGRAPGLTLVNMRYRGLGRIEQTLTDAGDGTVREAFSTTEIIPGAAGAAPAVSPKIPPSTGRMDRGDALRHRLSAWISKMAKGAGVSLMEFQCRPATIAEATQGADGDSGEGEPLDGDPAGGVPLGGAILASLYERQGDLRAMTECFPGDATVGQTDEEWFANSDRHVTQAQLHLLLRADPPFVRAVGAPPPGVVGDDPGPGEARTGSTHAPRDSITPAAMRTRWKELDQYVRDRVNAELGRIPALARPAVGVLLETDLPENLRNLATRVPTLREQGVRMLLIHNPGWRNHRFRGPDGGPDRGGGGICSIYDWRATSDNVEPWRALTHACAAEKIAYYPWLSGMVWGRGPFAEAVGRNPVHWAINKPGETSSRGYEGHLNHNPRDDRCMGLFRQRIADARAELGLQGFWADSFQNLFMSSLAWGDGSGAPFQRLWWEEIAALSRRGVGWMAESHAMPGLSCSIEVPDWEKDLWYFQHVCKWYRNGEQRRYEPEELSRRLFVVMAQKGWTAPDLYPAKQASWLIEKEPKYLPEAIIPGFARMARAYEAALPTMRRPYILPGDAGVLWLAYDNDEGGVLFPFAPLALPRGVQAWPIAARSAEALTRSIEPWRVYRIQALEEDVATRLGIQRGPLPDPRLGRRSVKEYATWPAWARELEEGIEAPATTAKP